MRGAKDARLCAHSQGDAAALASALSTSAMREHPQLAPVMLANWMHSVASTPMSILDRYVLYDEIAHGGMATVHVGRLVGLGGFSRTVAIKRLHAHLAREPEFVAMFLDEARL